MSSTSKATSFARVITNRQVDVMAGRPDEGPHTNGRKIVMGEAMRWDEVDRFGILIHECCHILFPANYPAGNIRELANLIDDCRIERQFIATRPQYQDALASVATNCIANGMYEDPQVDHWTEEKFDPSLWALLFFRPHVGDDVRLAAADAINAYADRKGYRNDPAWEPKFKQLVTEAQRITRLKTVSKNTLEAWCKLYFEVFPEAKTDANGVLAVAVLSDQPAPKGSQDQDGDGEGDAKADARILAKATGGDPGDGEGEEGEDDQQDSQGGDQQQDSQSKPQKPAKAAPKAKGKPASEGEAGEAPVAGDLEEKLEKLKDAVGKVGDLSKAKASQGEAGEDAKRADDSKPGEAPEEGEEQDMAIGGMPGWGSPTPNVAKTQAAVDKNFVIRVKQSMRKLRCLTIDRVNNFRKTGRLHMPTVIGAERKGILPRKPFINNVEDVVDAPVACVVATDFSGSTEGCNSQLNKFSHNALFALQDAGCECAEVVWNSSAWVTKRLDEIVSPVVYKRHSSDGGTCLIAATKGCIQALKGAKAGRKVAFIFTDGGVNHSEVAMVHKHLKDNGFEAALLVSIGDQVPKYGIVETVVCNEIPALAGVFDRWVRKQMAKTVESA